MVRYAVPKALTYDQLDLEQQAVIDDFLETHGLQRCSPPEPGETYLYVTVFLNHLNDWNFAYLGITRNRWLSYLGSAKSKLFHRYRRESTPEERLLICVARYADNDLELEFQHHVGIRESPDDPMHPTWLNLVAYSRDYSVLNSSRTHRIQNGNRMRKLFNRLHSDPEWKAKHREAIRKGAIRLNADPEFKARRKVRNTKHMSDLWQTDEFRRRLVHLTTDPRYVRPSEGPMTSRRWPIRIKGRGRLVLLDV